MRRRCGSILAITLLLSLAGPAAAQWSEYRAAPSNKPGVFTSGHTSGRFKAVAGTDTFCLYGGPGSIRGKFQTASVSPLTSAQLLAETTTVSGESDGWIFDDVTDQPSFWQTSTFNASNLNSNGGGNSGKWAGRSSAQQPGWANAPGYGNSWNSILEWRTGVSNTGVGQTVTLSGFYNLDSEAGFDFFDVEYDSAGTWINAFSNSGTNKDSVGSFAAPGLVLSVNLPYDAGGYATGDSEIAIRLAARSDGGYSDEDGLIDTDGLVQVDDLTVFWADGGAMSDTDSFEGADTGPNWTPTQASFAGYFGRVFGFLSDLDPCRGNVTPMFAFIDDGTPPSNPSYVGTGTGGTTSTNWSYGLPGGWVVNYNGGVSGGLIPLHNRIITPPVAWDLPGSADDGTDVAGAFARFDVYNHLPAANGIFYTWEVRARDSTTGDWTPWQDRNLVYFNPTGEWQPRTIPVADLTATANGPDGVQLALGVVDLASFFALPGTDATISPMFDNVGLFKHRIGGPIITAREIDMFQDSFPQSGLIASSTQMERDLLDIRIDMARCVSTGALNVPGDSMVVDVVSAIPGNSIATSDIIMHWSLRTNATFEDAIRGNLTGHPNATEVSTAPDTWVGQEAAQETGIPNRYFFDLPDSDFMYPGDVLHWYIEATDNGALTTTLPPNPTGFGFPKGAPTNKAGEDCITFHFYSQWKNTPYRQEGRPSIWLSFNKDGQPTNKTVAPSILMVDETGSPHALDGFYQAAFQVGLWDYVDYDVYHVKAPGQQGSNGIGSAGAHGATAAQLATYDCIIYLSADETTPLSNGSNTGTSDKSDDIGLLTSWHSQAATRYKVFMGDNLVAAASASSATFLSNIMGVTFNDGNVADEIGGVLTPLVTPTVAGGAAGFAADFVGYAGCTPIRDFDSIDPNAASASNFVSHLFNGGTIHAPQTRTAGVVYDRVESGFRKVDVTFPMDFARIYNGGSIGAGVGLSDRSILLQELIAIFSHTPTQPPVDTPPDPEPFRVARMFPNPFNPQTTLKLSVPRRGHVSARIYNLRGEVIRELVSGDLEAGVHDVVWTGTDARGARVSSGVYLVRVQGFGRSEIQKVMLLK